MFLLAIVDRVAPKLDQVRFNLPSGLSFFNIRIVLLNNMMPLHNRRCRPRHVGCKSSKVFGGLKFARNCCSSRTSYMFVG